MDNADLKCFTPAEVLRRVTAMGVLANPVIIWTYMRGRLAEAFPERAATAAPNALPVDEATFSDWLDDFLDEAEAQRAKLARAMNPLNDG